MYFNSHDLLELEDYLKLHNIPKDKVCLVGSTTLSLIGVRKHNDIDFVLHSSCQYCKLSDHMFIERVKSPWSTLFSDDQLIENADLHILYNGIKFVIPELVFHKKVWHNRLKDQFDIAELQEYANMHKSWNWELLQGSLPASSFLQDFLKKFCNKLNVWKKKVKVLLRRGDLYKYEQLVPTSHLLARQFLNESFNRYDLIVRYMAISSFLNKDDFGIVLYKKMQDKRAASRYQNPWRVFCDLIMNIKDNGYDMSKPILVNNDLHLIDGAHRLATALYFQQPFIPISINKKLSPSFFGIDWFSNNSFNNAELDVIEECKRKVFLKNYLYFEVVLWPPVIDYFDDIEKFIAKKFHIFSSLDYNNIIDFHKYIRDLYQIDDIRDWKVNLKIEAMDIFPKRIRIIKIEIPNPRFRYKDNGKIISMVVEELKKDIRSKYKSKVNNYFHDIIIHIGDNYYHSQQSKKILI